MGMFFLGVLAGMVLALLIGKIIHDKENDDEVR